MKALLPHQQDLLRRLEAMRRGTVLLRNPPGAGTTEVLVRLAVASQAAGETPVVLTEAALVEMWDYRLREAGAMRVVTLRRVSEVLAQMDDAAAAAEDGPVVLAGAVFVVSTWLLGTPLGERAAGLLTPSLLIVDSAGIGEGTRRRRSAEVLREKAARTVVADYSGDRAAWVDAGETIEWNQEDVWGWIRRGAVVLERYAVGTAEADAYRNAGDLLSRIVAGPVSPGATRPAIHAALLRAIDRLVGDPVSSPPADGGTGGAGHNDDGDVRRVSVDELWDAVDRIENLPDDGRLDVVRRVAAEAIQAGRLCLILTERLVEADYLLAYLSERDVGPRSVSGGTPAAVRDEAMMFPTPREVVIATDATVTPVGVALPRHSLVVWWSSPSSVQAAQRRLSLTAGRSDIILLALASDPPVLSDRALIDDVLPRLRETGVTVRD
jgi:hypothetical protein